MDAGEAIRGDHATHDVDATLPGPLTALMPLLALRLTELSLTAILIVPEPPVPSARKPPPLFLSMWILLRVTSTEMPPVGLIDKAGCVAEDR